MVCIRKGTTKSNTDTIQRKSTRKFLPMSGRNLGSIARDANRVDDLKEEERKEANRTKISTSLSKRRRSCSVPSRNYRQSEWTTTTKVILLILVSRVPMMRLDPTATTPRLRVRLLEKEKVKVEEINKNDPVRRLGRL